jgi:anion-transporting  ArsA/GET3 family ATPase
MDTEDHHGELFEAGKVGTTIAPLRENVSGLMISPRVVVEEYLRSRLKFRALAEQIIDSRVFQYFYEAAPALKELTCLLKLRKLVEERSWWSQRHTWDTVVFDAPATGHGLGLWGVPESASNILIGPMKTTALRVRDMLRNPGLTSLNIVTIPEEMPVNEAEALFRASRDALGMPLGFLFLNAVVPESITLAEAAEVEGLADGTLEEAARAALGPGGEKAATGLRAAARFAAERAALSTRYTKEARERIDMPLVEIPYLPSRKFRFAEVEQVASILGEHVGSRPVGASA